MIGYLGRIIPGMPRGVGHTAYSIFKEFNIYTSLNPHSSFDSAAKFVLTSRKSTYKKTSTEELDFFTKIASSLGDIITIAVRIEDPACFDFVNIQTTRSSLRRFYQTYCPSELGSLEKVDFILRMIRDKRSKYKIEISILPTLTEGFVFAFEEDNRFNIERVIGYVSKVYLDSNRLRDIAKELIEYVMAGDEASAVCAIMPLIDFDNEAKPHIETGFSSIISGDMQLAFDEFLKAFSTVKRNI